MNIIERARAAAIAAGTVMAAAIAFVPSLAEGQIKIGVIVSATGPAASLGIPQKNSVALLPRTIGGKSVDYLVRSRTCGS
jgi:branched-chain amino acid transport system substrate-binding protein